MLLLLAVISLAWGGYLGHLAAQRRYDYSLAAAAIFLEQPSMTPELAGKYVVALESLQRPAARRPGAWHEVYDAAEIQGLAAGIKARASQENLKLLVKAVSLWLGGTLLGYALLIAMRWLWKLRRPR